ncbi:hypothetical protein F511_44412 [Dorcoceras hygrometricum]|uniref:Uncharacterized protein n=1 Tax=Dorcoceras hygrometricum TaxID=472368 RepID=A0A2Z6ZZ35_9LAMI|nr:hypothetical protein F511_44412 [Dorcoceras hygrometricum]
MLIYQPAVWKSAGNGAKLEPRSSSRAEQAQLIYQPAVWKSAGNGAKLEPRSSSRAEQAQLQTKRGVDAEAALEQIKDEEQAVDEDAS